jgi:DNA invertase Pin-like site-specific DNA recombinase
MNVIIFSRISSAKQDYKRQTEELKLYATSMGYSVVGIFEEIVSGAKKNEDRPILTEMMQFIAQNQVSKVLVWELSRLGRNASQVLLTLDMLNQSKISLYIKNYNLETLHSDENGNIHLNPLTQFMLQILNSVNEIERTSIVSRLRSGYNRHVELGKAVGRKVGYRKSNDSILNENPDILKLLRKGFSVRVIMQLTGKSSGLIQKIKRIAGMTTKQKDMLQKAT